MTPDKLREKGNRWRELGQYDLANIYNQHAAALEEIERLNAAWNALDSTLRERDKQVIALLAERRAERLKVHAEAMAEELEDVFGDHKTVAAYRAERGE